jgi:hypothetical protein
MKISKSVDPPKINPSLASYLQRPEVIAAAKKRMEAEEMAKLEQFAFSKGSITPSYPELTLLSASQALKGAKAIPNLISKIGDKSKTDFGKAARLFATDLIAGEAIDYADKDKEKPKTYEKGGKMKISKKYSAGGMMEYAKGGKMMKALKKGKLEEAMEGEMPKGKAGKRALLAMTLKKLGKK